MHTPASLVAAPPRDVEQPAPKTVVHIRPSPRWRAVNLRELWHYRELLYFLTWRDLKVRYKQTVLGAAWAVIMPLSTMLVFTVCFGKIGGFDQKSQGLPFDVFSYTALLPWIYFSNAVSLASSSLVSNANLVSKVYFPRLIVPASAVLAGLVDYLIAFVVLGALMAWHGLAPAPAAVVALPLLTLLVSVLALGVGLWLAALNVQYRDIRYVVPFLMTLWMYGSPIIYSMSWVAEAHPQYVWLLALNPMAGILEGFRAALLPSGHWDLAPLWLSVACAAVILVTGCLYFRRVEKTFADVV